MEPYADHSNYNHKSDLLGAYFWHHFAEGIQKKSHDPASVLVRGTSFQPSASTISILLAENWCFGLSINIDPNHKPSQLWYPGKQKIKNIRQFCETGNLHF